MKQPSGPQGAQQITQLASAFGRFFRQALERLGSPEFNSQFDPLAARAQEQLRTALSQSNSDESLARQAVTAALSTLRAAKQERAESALVWVDLSDDPPSDDATQNALLVQQAVSQLQDQRRRAVSLHLVGLTTAEIGAVLNWDEKKTQHQLEQGLQSLRKKLRAAGIDYEIDD